MRQFRSIRSGGTNCRRRYGFSAPSRRGVKNLPPGAAREANSSLGKPPSIGRLRLTGRYSDRLLVYRYAKSLQKTLVLSREPDSTVRDNFTGFGQLARFFLGIFSVFAFVEANSRLENQKNIIACTFYLSDRFGDSFGVGKRFVNCISEILH